MTENKIKTMLKNYRKKNGLNQKELADKLECSQCAISAWEKGTRLPDWVSWQKIVKLIGL